MLLKNAQKAWPYLMKSNFEGLEYIDVLMTGHQPQPEQRISGVWNVLDSILHPFGGCAPKTFRWL